MSAIYRPFSYILAAVSGTALVAMAGFAVSTEPAAAPAPARVEINTTAAQAAAAEIAQLRARNAAALAEIDAATVTVAASRAEPLPEHPPATARSTPAKRRPIRRARTRRKPTTTEARPGKPAPRDHRIVFNDDRSPLAEIE